MEKEEMTKYGQGFNSGAERTFVVGLTGSFKALLGGIGVLVLVTGGALLPVLAWEQENFWGSAEFWVFIVCFVFTLALTLPLLGMKTRLRVHADGMEIVNSGIFKKSLTYGEIEAVEVGPITGLLQGAGLRIMGGGQTGYLTGGPSVSFILIDGKVITVSCDEPDAAVALVRRRLGQASSPSAL